MPKWVIHPPNIYARTGILTHGILTLPTIAVEYFFIVLVGNQIAESASLSGRVRRTGAHMRIIRLGLRELCRLV
jgi:hypothetical protein